jgi:hypothetical protein
VVVIVHVIRRDIMGPDHPTSAYLMSDTMKKILISLYFRVMMFGGPPCQKAIKMCTARRMVGLEHTTLRF